jgi:hypothetical protein
VKVVCSAPQCREWAVAYVSKYEGPVPAPRHDPDAPYDKPGRIPLSLDQALGIGPPRFELWYACSKHREPFHRDHDGRRTTGVLVAPVCEYCGDDVGVAWESSRTMYHEEVNAWTHLLENVGDAPPSPNRDKALCRECAAEHHENWDGQWNDYYASRC